MSESTGKHWTADQMEFLRTHYPQIGLKATAKLLGFAPSRVRHKANVMGLKQDRESEFYKDWQQRAAASKVGKKRPEQAAVMKSAIHDHGLHLHAADVRASVGQATKERIAANGHPRGFLGGRHSANAKVRQAEASQARWDGMSDTERSEFVLKQLKGREAAGNLVPNKPHGSWKADWREIDGQRCYFRSRWEANYARYLGFLRKTGHIKAWEHEPETFWFEKIQRGARSYLPDFRVTENDGSIVYHEVKGWMDDRSKTKIKRMRIYHPKVELVVIERKGYEEIKRKLSTMLEGWES